MGERQALALQPLSDALWAERHELDSLLAHVVALRLVLQAGEHRFVSVCLNEVETAAARLHERSAARESLLEGIDPSPATVSVLATAAGPPLAWAFGEHEESLRGLVRDIDTEVRTTRRLARNARAETLDSLSLTRSSAADAAGLPDFGGLLGEVGSIMELQLRAQSCRGVLLALTDIVPDSLRSFLSRGAQD